MPVDAVSFMVGIVARLNVIDCLIFCSQDALASFTLSLPLCVHVDAQVFRRIKYSIINNNA